MLTIQDKYDYKPIEIAESFSFKNKLLLFSKGFSNTLIGLLGLLVRNTLFIVLLFGAIFVFSYFYGGAEEYKKLITWVLELSLFWKVFIGSFAFALPYGITQMIVVGNLLRHENLYLAECGFVQRYIRNIKVLAFTTLVLLTFSTAFSYVWQGKVAMGFDTANMTSWLWAMIALLLGVITYTLMLSNVFIYFAEAIYPMEHSWLRKVKLSFEKFIGIFSVIFPALFIHSIVIFIVMGVVVSLGVYSFEPLVKHFQTQSLDVIGDKVIGQVLFSLIFFGFLTFYFIYVVLNRAKIRSLLILFLLIEDMEEYEERLTVPLKKV